MSKGERPFLPKSSVFRSNIFLSRFQNTRPIITFPGTRIYATLYHLDEPGANTFGLALLGIRPLLNQNRGLQVSQTPRPFQVIVKDIIFGDRDNNQISVRFYIPVSTDETKVFPAMTWDYNGVWRVANIGFDDVVCRYTSMNARIAVVES